METVGSSSHTRIAIFTVRIMGPNWAYYSGEGKNNADAFKAFDKANQRVVDSLGSTLTEVEEKISEILPEGFYAKIDEA